MNYCENCGNKINQGDTFCTNCGHQLYPNNNQPYQNQKIYTVEDDKKANKLGIISLCLYFGPAILSAISFLATAASSTFKYILTIFSGLSGLSSLAAIVLMIIIRIKYPQNRLGKIIMWLYIILFILGIVLSIIIFVACIAFCGNELADCHGAF